MLEDGMLWLVDQPEHVITFYAAAVWLLGALVSVVRRRDAEKMPRSTYFMALGALYLLGGCAGLIFLRLPQALVAGYGWVLLLGHVIVTMINGALYMQVSLARARDAYGRGRMAILAFIPIVGLWLLFARSRRTAGEEREKRRLLAGGWAVCFGLALFALNGAVNAWLSKEAESWEQTPESVVTPEEVVTFMIRREGLEATLRKVAAEAEVTVPVALDEMTRLERIEASGTQMQRIYFTKYEGVKLGKENWDLFEKDVCENTYLAALLRAGASIREVLVETNGAPIGSVTVTRETCGF